MHHLDNLQLSISAQAFTDESECVRSMLNSLDTLENSNDKIFTHASELVARIRDTDTGSGIENFLHTYSLSTHEGVAIMCLAEALLRIPDHATADRLIEDKLADAEWSKYLNTGESFLMNASSWGLLLAGKVVNFAATEEEKPSAIIGRLIGRAGESVVREVLKQSMRFIGSQFVLGEDIEEAVKKSEELENSGYRFSYDMLGEGARTQEQAEAYVEAYHHAITMIAKHAQGRKGMGAPGISIKLSALHPRYTLVNEERVMRELYPRLSDIVKLAMDAGINVSIDAEEAARLDIELKLFRRLFNDPAFKDYEGIGFVMQAYQKRAFRLVDYLVELSRQAKKRMPLRLVKGAYWDSEIKNAQILGLSSYPVFTRKEHTDVSYLACAQKIIYNIDRFYPQFATHNALTVATIMELADDKRNQFEFQRLHGMGKQLQDQIIGDVPCRIYAPIGKHKDLLPYLIRRMLENGANTSFVSMLMDKHKSISELLKDPVASARKYGSSQNEAIPNPLGLYSNRCNSRGYDLGNLDMLTGIMEKVTEFKDCFWHAEPTLVAVRLGAKPKNITEPADEHKVAGYVLNEAMDNVDKTIAASKAAFTGWNKVSLQERIAIIEKFAELLAENDAEAIAIIMREGGKTISDAIAEVREAIDFCYYYAAQAKLIAANKLEGPTGEQNTIELSARGVFVCISPWNFPLAIFTGQVVAGLITGNTVIAKPAEQTPLVAAFAVSLLHHAGIPKDALQLVPGSGSAIGAALTGNEHIAGVVFTGSMDTARIINRTLAGRNGPIAVLIAETGGQNCMMVDSSALLEQVTDDVITSAFGSAGQRCSALRVLYVQEEIADNLIQLISGAMHELKIGNPFLDPSVDVGPVIDNEANEKLQKHIARMHKTARLLSVTPLTKAAEQGHYMVPHMFEIQSIHEIEEEVFGPVLHVIRYKSGEENKVFDEVNSTGYGLTFGLQSRIGEKINQVRECIHAGNLYINRSMIGATVGVQPFGGEGLSGTGPKAGGPYYLLRFMTERTCTINTAAIGGNLELLSGRNNCQ